MLLLRTQRLLIAIVTLLFAAGHGHQVLGQYEVHHHHGLEMHTLGEVHEHEGGEHHEDESDPLADADHMLAHHSALAAVQPGIVTLIVLVAAIPLVDVSAEVMPEAPVVGIDYPPQLQR